MSMNTPETYNPKGTPIMDAPNAAPKDEHDTAASDSPVKLNPEQEREFELAKAADEDDEA
jgi:hypothetical protein